MFRYGIISDFAPETGQVRVTFNEDGIVSDWLPVIVPFAMNDKMSIPISINEQVCCMMDAHCEDGVCLGAVMNDIDKPYTGASKNKFGVKFSDDCLIEYDKTTKTVTINALTGKVDITAAEINITGILKVTGVATVTGVLSVGGLGPVAPAVSIPGNFTVAGTVKGNEVVAGTKSLKNHTHPGVTVGGGTTGINT